jgi:hypothetical protein
MPFRNGNVTLSVFEQCGLTLYSLGILSLSRPVDREENLPAQGQGKPDYSDVHRSLRDAFARFACTGLVDGKVVGALSPQGLVM